MTRRFLVSLLPLALALTAGVATQAKAGIILDGGFENPTPGNYTSSLGDGWNVNGTIRVDNATSPVGVPHSGNQSVYLDYGYSPNTVSQMLTTIVNQTYLVSFWIADSGPNLVTVDFGSQTLFNGTAPTNGVSLASDYVNYAYTVTATSTTTNLSFIGQYLNSNQGNGTNLDDVTVDAAPEPATLAFTGLGCLALVTLRPLLKTPAPRG